MALEISIKTNTGIDLPSAYTKIVRVDVFASATKEQDPPAFVATCHWNTFANQEARAADASPVSSGQSSFGFDPKRAALPQAYSHLKSVVGFEQAVDC